MSMFTKKKEPNVATDRSSVFKSRLAAYEKTVATLEIELKAHTKKHRTGAVANQKFAVNLGMMSRLEHYDGMKSVFSAVEKGFDKVAEGRIELLAEGGGGDVILLRVAATKSAVIGPIKALLADRDAKVKLVETQTGKFEAARATAGKKASAEITKQRKAAEKTGQDAPTQTPEEAAAIAISSIEMPEILLDAKDALAHTDKVVDENSIAYEQHRIADLQLLLEDFVRRELAWHCAAVETLTPLIKQLRGVDGSNAAKALEERLGKVELGKMDLVMQEAELKKRGFSVVGDGPPPAPAVAAAEEGDGETPTPPPIDEI